MLLKHSCLLYWLRPRKNSMQFTPIFLRKLCHCYVHYIGVNLLCSGSWYLKDDSDPDLIWVSKRCLLYMYSCNYLFQLLRRRAKILKQVFQKQIFIFNLVFSLDILGIYSFFSHNSLPNSPKGLRQLIQIHEMHGNVENETKGEQTNIKLG